MFYLTGNVINRRYSYMFIVTNGWIQVRGDPSSKQRFWIRYCRRPDLIRCRLDSACWRCKVMLLQHHQSVLYSSWITWYIEISHKYLQVRFKSPMSAKKQKSKKANHSIWALRTAMFIHIWVWQKLDRAGKIQHLVCLCKRMRKCAK